METQARDHDVADIGTGHTGIEVVLDMETACLAVSLDAVGDMPCDPAMGGTGKGCQVQSPFAAAEMCPDEERPAENT